MFIKNLKLLNFRCYEEESINFDPKFNIFVGLNAQGKTSLIEAIGLLSFFKSFRNSKNIEIIKKGTQAAFVKAKVNNNNLDYDLTVKIIGNKKQAFINEKHCKLLSEYIGKILAVSFSPADLEIIKGAPEYRRIWIDRIAQTINKKHIDVIQKYNHVLDHRNKILKLFAQDKIKNLPEDFEIWTNQLIELGSKIIINRVNAVKQINPNVEEHYCKISNKKNIINLDYFCSIFEQESGQNQNKKDIIFELDNIKKIMEDSLKNCLKKDCILGSTSIGPHRDDLILSINFNEFKSFASQGEIRSMVLAMRLSESDEIKRNFNLDPIMLIDDFSSELDIKRRELLLNFLEKNNSQVFITTTEEINHKKIFYIENGRVLNNVV
jgi:DNA replication and repair protein RecF